MPSAVRSLLSAFACSTTTAMIVGGAGAVLIERDGRGLARGGDGFLLHRGLLREQRQRGEVVLDLLEAGEHRRPIRRDGLVVARDRLRPSARVRRPASKIVCASAAPSDQ